MDALHATNAELRTEVSKLRETRSIQTIEIDTLSAKLRESDDLAAAYLSELDDVRQRKGAKSKHDEEMETLTSKLDAAERRVRPDLKSCVLHWITLSA